MVSKKIVILIVATITLALIILLTFFIGTKFEGSTLFANATNYSEGLKLP